MTSGTSGEHGGYANATRGAYDGIAVCNAATKVMTFVVMGPQTDEAHALGHDLHDAFLERPLPASPPSLGGTTASAPHGAYFQLGMHVESVNGVESALKRTLGELGWTGVDTGDNESGDLGALFATHGAYKGLALVDRMSRAVTFVVMGPAADIASKLRSDFHDRFVNESTR